MINWTRLTELRDEIGADDFNEVVEIFLEEVEESLTSLSAAPPDADLRDIMHFLKGSALNLGFEALAELCRDGEDRAAKGQSVQIDREAVAGCYQSSRDAFLTSEGVQAA